MCYTSGPSSISGGDQIFLILYCLKKKACERERLHLMNNNNSKFSHFLQPIILLIKT